MNHDPEKNAAAYLGAVMPRRCRKAFEAHVLECEDCWREVDLGRHGRTVAESGRELAPQPLRELVRATIASVTPRRRRFRWGLTVMVVAAVIAIAAPALWVASRERQPAPIEAVLANFQGDLDLAGSAAGNLPRRLGDLRLRDTEAGVAGGLEVVVHHYEDEAGHVVAIYQSNDEFPVAEGAAHSYGADTWTATLGEKYLFCAATPVPSLVVGDDAQEVALAVDRLDLR